MPNVTATSEVQPTIRQLADAIRVAKEDAHALGFGDKQLAISALARITSKAANCLTSSPRAHAAPETAEMRELASSLQSQDALRSDGLFMPLARKLIPHISFVGVGIFLFAVGQSVGAGAFAALAAGGTAVFILAFRMAVAAGPAFAEGFGQLFNEPAEVKKLLAKHVDFPERRLYSGIGLSPPFRPITLLGPIGGMMVVIAIGLVIAGAAAGFSEASEDFVEQNTPQLPSPLPTPSQPTYP